MKSEKLLVVQILCMQSCKRVPVFVHDVLFFHTGTDRCMCVCCWDGPADDRLCENGHLNESLSQA